MPRFAPSSDAYADVVIGNHRILTMKEPQFELFTPLILGLGDISEKSTPADVICAVFDLQGFSTFSKQVEPHLAVPRFLDAFLHWLFEQVRVLGIDKDEKFDGAVPLYAPLPMFAKFMGDGVMFLWDISSIDLVTCRNLVLQSANVCDLYAGEFLKKISSKIVDAPPKLRCGVAMGRVYSVGDGQDYVGACINIAARLEKTPGLTFAFNIRGFNLEDESPVDFFTNDLVIKKMSIRGIGENELVAITKVEYEALSSDEKKLFRDP